MKGHIAGHFTEKVTDEEQPCSPSEYCCSDAKLSATLSKDILRRLSFKLREHRVAPLSCMSGTNSRTDEPMNRIKGDEGRYPPPLSSPFTFRSDMAAAPTASPPSYQCAVRAPRCPASSSPLSAGFSNAVGSEATYTVLAGKANSTPMSAKASIMLMLIACCTSM